MSEHKVDQFESVFRAADKPVFRWSPPDFRQVLLVTDLPPRDAEALADRLRGFLAVLGAELEWRVVAGEEAVSVESLLGIVQDTQPDLVCTYRNLHSDAWRWTYGLGPHLDVLTQAVPCPALLLPHPRAERAATHTMQDTDRVMAITHHLVGDDSLVNTAARFCQPGGSLWLAHVEDDVEFERFVAAVSKIPTLDTDETREQVRLQLLKEPHDYIRSCREGMAAAGQDLTVEEVVTFGHRLSEYRRIVERQQVDLLVLHAKDEDQSAMHGLAWPLAVELTSIPLLLL